MHTNSVCLNHSRIAICAESSDYLHNFKTFQVLWHLWAKNTFNILFDPWGRPIVKASSDNCFRTCRLYVPTFQNKKVSSENNICYWRDWPSGSLMTPVLLLYDFSSFFSGISHMTWNGHNYFLSWREPWHKFEDWDWFNGRNFCRDRCMDLVSFDSPEEFQIFSAIMQRGE